MFLKAKANNTGLSRYMKLKPIFSSFGRIRCSSSSSSSSKNNDHNNNNNSDNNNNNK